MPSRIALSLALCLAAISSQAADRITDQPFATRSEK